MKESGPDLRFPSDILQGLDAVLVTWDENISNTHQDIYFKAIPTDKEQDFGDRKQNEKQCMVCGEKNIRVLTHSGFTNLSCGAT